MATSQRSDAGGAGGVTDHAFAQLRPAMLALAYRITGSRADAEDIVQDAFSCRTSGRDVSRYQR
jgi:RNA polymerase sigma-70 factor (ECF subfamily)